MNNISKKIKDVLKRKAMTATLATASLFPGAVNAHNNSTADSPKHPIEAQIDKDIYGKKLYKNMQSALMSEHYIENEDVIIHNSQDENGKFFISLQNKENNENFCFDEHGYFEDHGEGRKYSVMPKEAKKIAASAQKLSIQTSVKNLLPVDLNILKHGQSH